MTRFLLPILSFLFSLYFTPLAMKIAEQYNMVDRPDGKLKLQKKPIPYLGGASIFLSFILSLSLLYNLNKEILALLFASTIILFTGFVDDLITLSPGSKLIGETLATWVLVRGGIRIKLAFLPMWASILLTFLWILFMTNAFNLIDIMDGLAGTVAAFSSLSFAVIAIFFHSHTTGVVGLSLAGAILGFLVFNLPPAKIYLGDTGSLFLGFSLGSMAVLVDYTLINPVGFLSPFFILWVPIFEVIFVSAVRFFKGLSLFKGSPDHFPYRLAKILGSREKALGTAFAIHLSLCLSAIILVRLGARTTIYFSLGIIIFSIIFAIFLSRVKT